MELKVGEFYENKTKQYLLPCLRYYGRDFKFRFDRLYKFAVGIHDVALEGHELTEQNLIYILFDKAYRSNEFKEFLEWIKCQHYYVTDYVSAEELSSRKHMVVIRIPDNSEIAYQMFLQSRYSLMYVEHNKELLFDKDIPKSKEALSVTNKEPKALTNYFEQLKKVFNDFNVKREECRDHDEYLLPLIKKQEVFNYERGEITFNKTKTKVWMDYQI